MTPEISLRDRLAMDRSLQLSLIEGFFSSLMVGVGESYLPAYVLSIGMSQVLAGILASLPVVSGAFLQLLTPRLMRQIPSHKTWVVGSALIQAFALLPLIYFSLGAPPGFWTLFLVLTLYWGAGLSSGSAWNYWMGQLVPEERSAKYFALRTRLSQLGVFAGIVAGGVALHRHLSLGPVTSTFALLFLSSFAVRILSSYLLSRKFYHRSWAEALSLVPLRLFFAGSNKRRFFIALIPFQMAIAMSSPFVSPFMLAQLKMNYAVYMGAIALLFLGKILALYVLEKWRSQIEVRRLMLIGALLMVPCPALWILSSNYYYLLGLQAVSGVSLACFEVGLALILFQDVPQKEKVAVLSVYNVFNSLAVIAGTLIGGEVLAVLGEIRSSYWVLFGLATLLRAGFCGSLARATLRWRRDEEIPIAPQGKTAMNLR